MDIAYNLVASSEYRCLILRHCFNEAGPHLSECAQQMQAYQDVSQGVRYRIHMLQSTYVIHELNAVCHQEPGWELGRHL